jgi:hypothetical protein
MGTGLAVATALAGVVFRFFLPLTVGTFFGARDVWGWSTAASLLFAAPGLFLIIPGVVSQFFGRKADGYTVFGANLYGL